MERPAAGLRLEHEIRQLEHALYATRTGIASYQRARDRSTYGSDEWNEAKNAIETLEARLRGQLERIGQLSVDPARLPAGIEYPHTIHVGEENWAHMRHPREREATPARAKRGYRSEQEEEPPRESKMANKRDEMEELKAAESEPDLNSLARAATVVAGGGAREARERDASVGRGIAREALKLAKNSPAAAKALVDDARRLGARVFSAAVRAYRGRREKQTKRKEGEESSESAESDVDVEHLREQLEERPPSRSRRHSPSPGPILPPHHLPPPPPLQELPVAIVSQPESPVLEEILPLAALEPPPPVPALENLHSSVKLNENPIPVVREEIVPFLGAPVALPSSIPASSAPIEPPRHETPKRRNQESASEEENERSRRRRTPQKREEEEREEDQHHKERRKGRRTEDPMERLEHRLEEALRLPPQPAPIRYPEAHHLPPPPAPHIEPSPLSSLPALLVDERLPHRPPDISSAEVYVLPHPVHLGRPPSPPQQRSYAQVQHRSSRLPDLNIPAAMILPQEPSRLETPRPKQKPVPPPRGSPPRERRREYLDPDISSASVYLSPPPAPAQTPRPEPTAPPRPTVRYKSEMPLEPEAREAIMPPSQPAHGNSNGEHNQPAPSRQHQRARMQLPAQETSNKSFPQEPRPYTTEVVAHHDVPPQPEPARPTFKTEKVATFDNPPQQEPEEETEPVEPKTSRGKKKKKRRSPSPPPPAAAPPVPKRPHKKGAAAVVARAAPPTQPAPGPPVLPIAPAPMPAAAQQSMPPKKRGRPGAILTPAKNGEMMPFDEEHAKRKLAEQIEKALPKKPKAPAAAPPPPQQRQQQMTYNQYRPNYDTTFGGNANFWHEPPPLWVPSNGEQPRVVTTTITQSY